MIRFAILALCSTACGRGASVADQDLPGLVVEVRRAEPPIDVARAARDPVELGRALARPYRVVLAALGPHRAVLDTVTIVDEGDHTVSELTDHAQLDLGEDGAYHAVYTNSADYGRETTYVGGKLYLRPRYQRWHARAPEEPDEPDALRDQYAGAIAATWDLLGPGAELTDRGVIDVAGRPGRKISVARAAEPGPPPAEPLTQRKWRERRTIDAVAGEVVLDADKGVPLVVKLTGTVGFARDGRRFAMKLSLDSAVSGIGSASVVAAPPDSDVVATPERLREVDDRDFLLQGIAPPLRRNPDGTAVAPTPNVRPGSELAPGGGSGGPATRPSDAPPKPPAKPAEPPARRARSDAGKPNGGKP